MAKKTVDLTIRLKDGVSGVLTRIGSGLKRAGGLFKGFAVAGLAATTAVIGGFTALAKAYSEQESVNKRLKDTFDAAGESGAKAVVKWGKFATAIQRVTTLGDEEIMNLISLAKTMGISNDKIGEATKGAIGLSKAFGIDLNSSMKMVALAMQGEYTMLQRYIPELRAATTETEKLDIVNRAMARGFKVASGELDTISGQWKALKGVIGDAMQEAGRVIFGDGGLVNGLEQVKNKIIELTEGGAITQWAKKAKEGLDAVVAVTKIIAKGGEGRSQVLKAFGEVLRESFKSAVGSAIELLLKYAPAIGESIGSSVLSLVGITRAPKNIREKKDEITQIEIERARQQAKTGGLFRSKEEKQNAKDAVDYLDGTIDKLKKELNVMTQAWESGIIEVDTGDLKGALENLSSVFDEFNTETGNPDPTTKLIGQEVETATEKGAEKGVKSALRIDRALSNGINKKPTGSIYEPDGIDIKKEDGGMKTAEPFRYYENPKTGNLSPFAPPKTGNLSMAGLPTSGFGPLNGVKDGVSDSQYLKQIADNTKGGLL